MAWLGESASWVISSVLSHRNARLPEVPTMREVVIRSSESPNGCGIYTTPEPLMVVPLHDYIVEDPSVLGMEILPDRNEWGFAPPLSVKTFKIDVISCNGFENCPTP